LREVAQNVRLASAAPQSPPYIVLRVVNMLTRCYDIALMDDQLLFHSGDLSNALRSQLERMRHAIDNCDSRQLQSAELDVLIEQFVRIAHVEPVVLDEERIKPEQRPTKVSVSGRFEYGPWHDSGGVMVDGIEVMLRVPFSGDQQLFRLQPSTFNFNPPRGHIIANEVLLSASGPPHDANRIKSHLERELDSLKQYVGWSRANVQSHNATLANAARTALETRRQRLASIPDIASTFSFGKKTQ
jgi:hypothetical protein